MSIKTTEQLNDFINHARKAGKSNDDITQLLINAGWKKDDVARALSATEPELLPPPPPPPPDRTPGWEVFFALMTFFTLGISAVALGGILFALINKALPDLTVDYYYNRPGIASALAAFIVATPIFIALSWRFVRDLKHGLVSSRYGIRRILTYIALFIASATVIGDVIALVYRFLAGEVNTRFLLKVITILLIGGWIVWYYWMNLKHEEKGLSFSGSWHRNHGLVLAVVALVSVVGGFYLTGTPQDQRAYVRDQRRISDLQALYYNVQEYYARNEIIPTSLAELQQGYLNGLPNDPETGSPYEYVVSDETRFQLCANFETDDADRKETATPRQLYGPYDVNWSHPAGEYCFTLEAKRPKF